MTKNTVKVISFLVLIMATAVVGILSFTHIFKKPYKLVSVDPGQEVIPVVVIGSGPAGLAAALYGGRAAVKTVVVEGPKPGGALTETSYVENWPGEARILGNELIASFKKQAVSFGAEFMSDAVASVDSSRWPFLITLQSGQTLLAYSIIIATGSSPKFLGIPGEHEYWGKGVTTCAVCDAPFYKDKDVVVIGGGDSAAEEALQLKPFARKIYILVRKSSMRAAEYLQKRLQSSPNMEILYNTEVVEVLGDGKHVKQVRIKDARTGALSLMNVEGVFLAIGHTPNTGMFNNQFKLDPQGRLVMVGRTQQTSIEGIYAAGDVEDPHMQANVASGHGIEAMLEALAWLKTQNVMLSPVPVSVPADTPKDMPKRSSTAVTQQPQKSGPGITHIRTLAEYEQKVKKAGTLPVIVDFYADYCSSCKRMMPYVQEAAQQFSGKALFYKVDAGVATDIAKAYEVRSLPTILVFKNGTLVERITKSLTLVEIQQLVQGHL